MICRQRSATDNCHWQVPISIAPAVLHSRCCRHAPHIDVQQLADAAALFWQQYPFDLHEISRFNWHFSGRGRVLVSCGCLHAVGCHQLTIAGCGAAAIMLFDSPP